MLVRWRCMMHEGDLSYQQVVPWFVLTGGSASVSCWYIRELEKRVQDSIEVVILMSHAGRQM